MNTPINIKIAEILFKKHGVLLSNISDVVMWLYEKHEVWICVRQDYDNGKFEEFLTHKPKLHDTPTAAYEAAILHILNNLI